MPGGVRQVTRGQWAPVTGPPTNACLDIVQVTWVQRAPVTGPPTNAYLDVVQVTCFHGLHLLHVQEALAEMHRIIKPGGRLVVAWNDRYDKRCTCLPAWRDTTWHTFVVVGQELGGPAGGGRVCWCGHLVVMGWQVCSLVSVSRGVRRPPYSSRPEAADLSWCCLVATWHVPVFQ